jgi:hypothetical protein
MAANAGHGSADHIVRAGRSRGGCDQDAGGTRPQQVLQSARDGALIFGGRQCVAGSDAETLQALPHHRFKELAGPFAVERIGI